MAIQEATGNRPPVDNRLLSADSSQRLTYGLEVFRGLVGSERFGRVLSKLGFNGLQAPFVGDTARLILQEDRYGLFQGNSAIFRPGNDHENKPGGRYTEADSSEEGEVGLAVYFPREKRELESGLVNWGVIKRDEADVLKPLFNGVKPFLRLVAMDPSIFNVDDLKPFVEATHADEPGLKPKTFLNSLRSIFEGNPLYEANTDQGIVRIVRYEKGKVGTEEWVTIPPAEGEGFLLVGKKANPKAA